MDNSTDSRELLFGITALRMGLADRTAVADALSAWGSSRDLPFGRFLVERGVVPGDRLDALDAEVSATLKVHRGDARRALGASGQVGQELKSLLWASADPFDTLGEATAVGEPSTLATQPATDAPPHARGEPAGTEGATTNADPFGTLAESTVAGMPTGNWGDQTVAVIPGAGPGPGADAGAGYSGARGPRPGDGAHSGAASALRYKVLRLHARGGLGQVFLAKDEELNREVALKEIQGRHADDDDSRTRFLIEAEVTGNLEHPGIVPVYGLGRYPDGRPYYAMRFVRGESMQEAIGRYHDGPGSSDPGARELALRKLIGQIVDVCNAMAYAHTRGVLHRDLKPANVMLGAFGETLVVDWGLAKFKDGPTDAPGRGSTSGLIRPMSAGSGSHTRLGSAVGTPQFMSPEQAAGKHDQLGPASDIYSLGAMLYVTLVGKPPFTDRELMQVLYKVSRGDFRRPREVDPKAPAALEAVCMKAMALSPEDRYPTAAAMAEDLERWLADEPVSAYREPARVKAARWARRHKPAVAAACALLVTAVASLAVYSVLIKREQARTERFYLLARRAVDEMLTRLGEDDLADVPQMEPVRAKMLRAAKAFYEDLRTARADDPKAARDVGLATLRLADIETFLGDKAALARYDDAAAKLRAQLTRSPGDRDAVADLGRALHARGLLLRKLNRLDDARRDLAEALKLREGLASRFPADPDLQRARINTLYHLAALDDRRGRSAEARKGYQAVIGAQKAVADGPAGSLDDRRLMGRYTNNLANLVSRDRGEARKEATALYRQAADVQQDVVKRDPVTALYRYELAKTLGNLRISLTSDGRPQDAEPLAAADLDLSRRLAHDFPRVPEYQGKLAAALSNIGELQLRAKRHDDAGKALDEAVGIADRLVAGHGDQRDFRSVLSAALVNRASLRTATARPKEAEADLLKAREALRPVTEGAGATPEDVFDRGTVAYKLAALRAGLGRDAEAVQDVNEAEALHERASALGRTGEGDAPAVWRDVSLLSDLLQHAGQYERCADACERLPALRPDHAGSYLRAARMMAFLCQRSAATPDAEGRARGYADRVLKVLEGASSRDLLDPSELESPQYTKVREIRPDRFRDLKEAVRRRVRI